MSWRMAALLALVTIPSAFGQEPPPEVTSEERALLEELEGFVYVPPPEATCVRVPVPVRTVWASTFPAEEIGWRVGEQVFLVDGRGVPWPDDAAPLEPFDLDSLDPAAEELPLSPYVAAAWLARRGHEEAAAAFLRRIAREREGELARLNPHHAPTLANLRLDLAWRAFAGLVHAYMVRADEEALDHGERLLRLFPAEADAEWPQARRIVDELKRREAAGRLGASPREVPEDLADRPVEAQVTWWIRELEEVDARQFSQPGGVDLASDRRPRRTASVAAARAPQRPATSAGRTSSAAPRRWTTRGGGIRRSSSSGQVR